MIYTIDNHEHKYEIYQAKRVFLIEQHLFPDGLPNMPEVCPRCTRLTMGKWQKDACCACAYMKGDEL